MALAGFACEAFGILTGLIASKLGSYRVRGGPRFVSASDLMKW